jgi:hypothetical protein
MRGLLWERLLRGRTLCLYGANSIAKLHLLVKRDVGVREAILRHPIRSHPDEIPVERIKLYVERKRRGEPLWAVDKRLVPRYER